MSPCRAAEFLSNSRNLLSSNFSKPMRNRSESKRKWNDNCDESLYDLMQLFKTRYRKKNNETNQSKFKSTQVAVNACCNLN